MKDTDCSHYDTANGDCLTNACSGCCVKYRAELEALRLTLAEANRDRETIRDALTQSQAREAERAAQRDAQTAIARDVLKSAEELGAKLAEAENKLAESRATLRSTVERIADIFRREVCGGCLFGDWPHVHLTDEDRDIPDRLEIAEDDRDDLAAMYEAATDRLTVAHEALDIDNAVCLCGCPASEHEDNGEDGEQCGHEDHVCLWTCPAILAYVNRLRADLAARPPIAWQPCPSYTPGQSHPECPRCGGLGAVTAPTLDALAIEADNFARTTFPSRSAESISEHLRREAVELAAAPTDPEEMADVFILLGNLVHFTGTDLNAAVVAKLAKNRARKWGKPDAHGVVEHVRDEVPHV